MQIIRSKKSLATLNNRRFFTPPTLAEICENPEWKPITLPDELDEQFNFFDILDKKRLTSE